MRNRALKYTIIFSLVGLILSVFITYVERNTISTYSANIPYIRLGENVKNNTTEAHLWLEEILKGETGKDYNRDVLGELNVSRALLQSAYDGEVTDLGAFDKASDEDTRSTLKNAIVGIDNLIESAQERWKIHQEEAARATDSTTAMSSTAGTDLDKKFDQSYEAFQGHMNSLILHVNEKVQADTTFLNLMSWISIALLITTFVILGFLLFFAQRSNDQLTQQAKLRLESQNRSVMSLTSFIEAISSGNYTKEISIENDESNLAGTLTGMRDKLRDNADNDRKRNWSTTGLAQIGEILRTPTKTTEELLDNIIRFVVKYTKSNQGGLFILNEDNESDSYLELMACYAFERKKYLTKKVIIGEGLIGQAYLEGDRMYLEEVPREYITITSGLGGSNPNALLIVPLKVNDKVYGVLELATFGKYQDYEIDLVEKLAESIASTISTVRVNESTRILLEKTQQQAEEMRAQEEEMRQNMEELEATQEEMRRKEKHIQNMLDGEKARNEISQRNRKVLMELSKATDVQSGNWNNALEKITSTMSQQLSVSRSSVWTLNQLRNKLTCEKTFMLRTRTFDSKEELLGKDAPDFFEAITREDVLVAKDASLHPATKELNDSYLQTHSIQSLLAVPFYSDGRLAGILTCEQQNGTKDWTEEDIEFLKSLADVVTVTHNTAKINKMLDQVNESQETMQIIIDNIPRAVFWKDKDLKFQGCNRIFAQIAGMRSTRDMIGKTDFDMPWRDHADEYRADDLAVMKSRKARLDHEEKNVNAEGNVSWVLTSKVPVTNHHGEVVAVLGMFEDITDRKTREADIQGKLKELEELRKMIGKGSN